jgi:hypothetical protein
MLGSLIEAPRGPCRSSYFAKASFDSIGGSYSAVSILRFVTQVGEQLRSVRE